MKRKWRLPHSTDYDLRWCIERRNRDGSIRRYWHPRGQKPVRLSDDLDWAKVATQLNRQRDASLGETVVVEGSVAWVIQKYRESDRFKNLSPASVKIYQRWLSEFEKMWGAFPISVIKKPLAVEFADRLKAQPATQKHAVAVLQNVLAEALYRGLIEGENPASRLRLSSSKRRDAIW